MKESMAFGLLLAVLTISDDTWRRVHGVLAESSTTVNRFVTVADLVEAERTDIVVIDRSVLTGGGMVLRRLRQRSLTCTLIVNGELTSFGSGREGLMLMGRVMLCGEILMCSLDLGGHRFPRHAHPGWSFRRCRQELAIFAAPGRLTGHRREQSPCCIRVRATTAGCSHKQRSRHHQTRSPLNARARCSSCTIAVPQLTRRSMV